LGRIAVACPRSGPAHGRALPREGSAQALRRHARRAPLAQRRLRAHGACAAAVAACPAVCGHARARRRRRRRVLRELAATCPAHRNRGAACRLAFRHHAAGHGAARESRRPRPSDFARRPTHRVLRAKRGRRKRRALRARARRAGGSRNSRYRGTAPSRHDESVLFGGREVDRILRDLTWRHGRRYRRPPARQDNRKAAAGLRRSHLDSREHTRLLDGPTARARVSCRKWNARSRTSAKRMAATPSPQCCYRVAAAWCFIPSRPASIV
jgi:hypothetical protein